MRREGGSEGKKENKAINNNLCRSRAKSKHTRGPIEHYLEVMDKHTASGVRGNRSKRLEKEEGREEGK
jgi:hypothetical protein